MTTMILLVGEQPAPNLLPLRHYNPTQVALVYTSLTQTRAERLAAVIGRKAQQPMCKTDAFRVADIQTALETYIQGQGWAGDELLFNLTGGTKTMALAAYEVARRMEAAAFYYQTEANQSLIHPYRFKQGKLIADDPVPITETLTLDDYLKLYVGSYTPNLLPKDPFEEMVYQVLSKSGLPDFEVMPSMHMIGLSGNVEVDMLARRGNQVAVFEIKRQAGKKGIDQLNGVTDQRTLGTYTRKILVSAAPLEPNNLELAKAYRIKVVTLPSGLGTALTDGDVQQLVRAVGESLEPKR